MKADVKATQKYYEQIDDTQLCDCTECQNYRAKISGAYPDVSQYLKSLGADIEKPFDSSSYDRDSNEIISYFGQYIIFGTCSEGFSHHIGDIKTRLATSHPGTGIEKEHFVLEIYPVKLTHV